MSKSTAPAPILYINWMGELGGAEMALLRLLKNLDRRHFEPHVWIFTPGSLENRLREVCNHVVVKKNKRFRNAILNICQFYQLIRYIHKNNIVLLHAVGTLSFILGFLPSRICRIPCIAWMMDIPEKKDINQKLAGKLKADYFIGISNAMISAFRTNYPRNPSKTVMIPLPFESAPTTPSLSDERKQTLLNSLGLSPNRPVISLFGRLQRWKGQEILIRSIPVILKSFPDAIFLIVGDSLPGMEPEYKNQLIALAKEISVFEHCRFLGFRHDVCDLMNLSHVIVHTSLNPEPFGLVIVEAMACAKPVVATKGGGPDDIIQSPQDGILINPGNPQELAEAVVKILSNPDLSKAMGDAARNKVLSLYSPTAVTAKIETVYHKLLGH